jgi:hypothetical protein
VTPSKQRLTHSLILGLRIKCFPNPKIHVTFCAYRSHHEEQKLVWAYVQIRPRIWIRNSRTEIKLIFCLNWKGSLFLNLNSGTEILKKHEKFSKLLSCDVLRGSDVEVHFYWKFPSFFTSFNLVFVWFICTNSVWFFNFNFETLLSTCWNLIDAFETPGVSHLLLMELILQNSCVFEKTISQIIVSWRHRRKAMTTSNWGGVCCAHIQLEFM